MNSYSIVLILIHGNLLEQSGQRPGGNHFPVPPQIQSANGKRRLKSHWSLHNGLHIRPKFQSSQAFAPFFGGGKSGHSLAKQSINGNQSTCKPFKKAENYDMYSCVTQALILACIHSFIHFILPLTRNTTAVYRNTLNIIYNIPTKLFTRLNVVKARKPI